MTQIKQIGDLEYVEITNKAASAKIALQGAHTFFFQALDKKPLLWLSERSNFSEGKAIRGGVPVCWPWFGVHATNQSLAKHGFARTALWDYRGTQELSEEISIATFFLTSSEATKALWPYDFELCLKVTVAHELSLSLTTSNLDTKPMRFTQALHTYFKIDAINELSLDGLDEKLFFDNVNHSFNNIQKGTLRFSQEIDRIYADVQEEVLIHEKDQTIHIATQGSSSIVVWNPWEERAKKMQDVSDYRQMICVESAHALDDLCMIEAGSSKTLTQTVMQRAV